MNIRIPLTRAAVATALAATAFAWVHTSPTVPAHAAVSMSLDARAPLHVTLLPVVSVLSDAGQPDDVVTMPMAAPEPLPVTLLPTVHVSALAANFSATPALVAAVTPRTRTTPSVETQSVAQDAGTRVRAEVAPMKLADAAPALRTRMLPR